jgi:hypothetical protein
LGVSLFSSATAEAKPAIPPVRVHHVKLRMAMKHCQQPETAKVNGE